MILKVRALCPCARPEDLKLISVNEIVAKDDFSVIRKAREANVLAAYPVPSGLQGIIPDITGRLGNASQSLDVFYKNEVTPLQELCETFKEWAGWGIVRLLSYEANSSWPLHSIQRYWEGESGNGGTTPK